MNIAPGFLRRLPLAALLIAGGLAEHSNAQLRVPACTAYLEPAAEGTLISSHSGITGWEDPGLKVNWFGELRKAGGLECSVELRLPAGAESRLRLTVAGQSEEAAVKGTGDNPVIVGFKAFNIAEPGYQGFSLESRNPAGKAGGEIQALVVSGPAAAEAHFNLKPRRNAASVHLAYPVPKGTDAAAFYCEATAVEDPLWTFYMACGWHRGYFGMQVNSQTERRIIFSVWDSGGEPVDRRKVTDENRVSLVAKGEGVVSGDFGNEGTGGHSHLVYSWKTNEKQRFLVVAKPTDDSHTIFSGYYFHPDKKQWVLISSWKAPKEGGYLRGLHSFSENFGGANGQLRRKALYGNQWLRMPHGQWLELTTASFSHDATGRSDRLDRFMGVEHGQFFLSNGGFIRGFTPFGEKFARPAIGQPPTDLKLPEPSEAKSGAGAKGAP